MGILLNNIDTVPREMARSNNRTVNIFFFVRLRPKPKCDKFVFNTGKDNFFFFEWYVHYVQCYRVFTNSQEFGKKEEKN